MFETTTKKDAHEFLCQVLDQLKEDADKIKKLLDDAQQQKELINPVVDNFEFQVTHSIQCTECFEIITKKEEFNNLCLELPNIKEDSSTKISLQDALELFFQDENVNFNCEKCSNNLVKITHKFSRLPRILILYLKRYQFEEGANLVKNDCSIDIPLNIQLKSLCNEIVDDPKLCRPLIDDRSTSPQVLTAIEPNKNTKNKRSSDVIDLNDPLPVLDHDLFTIDDSKCIVPQGYNEEEALMLAIEASLLEVQTTPSRPQSKREPLGPLNIDKPKWEDVVNDKVLSTYMDRQVTSRNRKSSKEDEILIDKNVEKIVGSENRRSVIQSLSIEDLNKVEQEKSLRKSSRQHTIYQPEAHTYSLVGLVSHLGQSSNSGHYICDVLNTKTNAWSCYDDLKVEKESENDVLKLRSSTGYIFFYMFNSPLVDEVTTQLN